MKTFKVKNYKGNIVESLKRFQESYKDMKIVEAREEGNELKIKSENVLNERTMDLSKLTFYHGSQVSPEVMKINPPSPENPFYVTTEKEYAEFYSGQAAEKSKYGKEGGLYKVKLAKSVKIFDPENSGDIKAISKYIPRLVQMMWFGTNIYGVELDHYETLDLYDVSRTLMPPIEKDQYENIVKIPKGNKELNDRFNQDLKELYNWCKERGYKRRGDYENFIRTEILKILDSLGYQVYYGTEVETKGLTAEIEANIYGIFNIKAIDGISVNRINNPNENPMVKTEKSSGSFAKAIVKCIEKNITKIGNDTASRKNFINSITNAIAKTKFFYSGYGKDSVEYLIQEMSKLSKRYSPQQLQTCLTALKNKYHSDLYTFIYDKRVNKIKKLMTPLFKAIENSGGTIDNNLQNQYNELTKS